MKKYKESKSKKEGRKVAKNMVDKKEIRVPSLPYMHHIKIWLIRKK